MKFTRQLIITAVLAGGIAIYLLDSFSLGEEGEGTADHRRRDDGDDPELPDYI